MAETNRIEMFHGDMALAHRAGNWFIAIAIVFLILGTLAIVEPFVAGLAVAALVGWLLVVGGIAHIVGAFRSGTVGRTIWQAIIGLVYLFGGFYFLTHPLIALVTLTAFLASVFFVEAVLAFIAYFSLRREEGSGWLLVNGIITLLLSVLIWRQWPSASIWAIGTLVGVNLIVNGVTRLMLGTTARSLWKRATTAA